MSAASTATISTRKKSPVGPAALYPLVAAVILFGARYTWPIQRAPRVLHAVGSLVAPEARHLKANHVVELIVHEGLVVIMLVALAPQEHAASPFQRQRLPSTCNTAKVLGNHLMSCLLLTPDSPLAAEG